MEGWLICLKGWLKMIDDKVIERDRYDKKAQVAILEKDIEKSNIEARMRLI